MRKKLLLGSLLGIILALPACSGCSSRGDLLSIKVTPANPSIAVGATRQFTATGTYEDSSTMDITSEVVWSSATTTIATITNKGIATGVAEGTSVITATSGTISGVVTLTVTTTPTPTENSLYVGGNFTHYKSLYPERMMQLNSDGTGSIAFNSVGVGFNGDVLALAVQADGKIIVGGSFTYYFDGTGHEVGRIARLNTNGTLDTTFNEDPVSSLFGPGFNTTVSSIAIQGDGKILVGGSFDRYTDKNPSPDFDPSHGSLGCVARLNTDGTLDTTFKLLGSGFNSSVSTIAIQSSGKILVGGSFISYDDGASYSVGHIARLSSAGLLDVTFTNGAGTGFDDDVYTIVQQNGGKILVGGHFLAYNDGADHDVGRIARLDESDGDLDTSFNLAGAGFNGEVRTIALQDDGNILVGGGFSSYNVGSHPVTIARLDADGGFDVTFTPVPGDGFNAIVDAISVQSDGKVLVGGHFSSYGDGSTHSVGKIARLNTDGTLDVTFSPGVGFNDNILAVIAQSNGKILVGGSFVAYDDNSTYHTAGYIAKLNKVDGALDTTFITGTGFDAYVRLLATQSDGKILVSGSFNSYNDGSDHTNLGYIARLNTDGTFDTTFKPVGSTGFDDIPLALAVQKDGKIVLVGAFNTYNGDPAVHIARLNSDGTLDTTFVTGTGFDFYPGAVAIQEDGKILVGGDFNTYNGDAVGHDIVRINTDGTMDTSFALASGTGFDFNVNAFLVQSDGKILAGGDFSSYDGTLVGHIARLNADGTLDTLFNSSGIGLDNSIYGLSMQSNGKILAGGSFSKYNGDSVGFIVSINSNGTRDTLFNPSGTGLNSGVNALKVQNDGKILVVGTFSSYNDGSDHRAGYITRLNTDGTFDTTFSLNKGFDGQVYGVTLK